MPPQKNVPATSSRARLPEFQVDRLAPVRTHPNPAMPMPAPAAVNPDGPRIGLSPPVAGSPIPTATAPGIFTADPDIRRTRRNGNDFGLYRRRRRIRRNHGSLRRRPIWWRRDVLWRGLINNP